MRTKLSVLIALTVLVLAQLACSVTNVVNEVTSNVGGDEKEANQLVTEITDIAIPLNFTADLNLSIASFTVIGYTDKTTQTGIMLIQFPQDVKIDQEEMLKKLRESSKDQNYGSVELTLLTESTVTVRGAETVLRVYEGTDSKGNAWRMASVPFQGKGGQAMLTVAGSSANWDDQLVETLIASMK